MKTKLILFILCLLPAICFAQAVCDKAFQRGENYMSQSEWKKAINAFQEAKDCYISDAKIAECNSKIAECKKKMNVGKSDSRSKNVPASTTKVEPYVKASRELDIFAPAPSDTIRLALEVYKIQNLKIVKSPFWAYCKLEGQDFDYTLCFALDGNDTHENRIENVTLSGTPAGGNPNDVKTFDIQLKQRGSVVFDKDEVFFKNNPKDEEIVEVLAPEDCNWGVKSKPSWCDARKKDKNILVITCEKGKDEGREGEIIIGTSYPGEEYVLHIEQAEHKSFMQKAGGGIKKGFKKVF